jgi:hypothetical protein
VKYCSIRHGFWQLFRFSTSRSVQPAKNASPAAYLVSHISPVNLASWHTIGRGALRGGSRITTMRIAATLIVVAFYVLHQDFWFWRDARPLVFGPFKKLRDLRSTLSDPLW